MTSRHSSFSDATKPTTPAVSEASEPSVLASDKAAAPSSPRDLNRSFHLVELNDLDRRAMQSQHEAERDELVLRYNQETARLSAEHERAAAALRSEVASLTKQLRIQEVRLQNMPGSDQTQTGDLEAQVDALEEELTALRQTLESERIGYAQRITEERGSAARALNHARREYRDELGKHVHSHRKTLASFRADLDAELAKDRARHAAALEEQHVGYERQLVADRVRAEAKLVAANERHALEAAAHRHANQQHHDRQAIQHKATIKELRSTSESSNAQRRELEKANQLLQVEIATLQKQALQNETEQASTARRTAQELALVQAELDGERERNTALRADVLRRSAEAHQAIDKAAEVRTAQLAELEASVARQRQYADNRVREVSAAAEEQARESASREASLTAAISRLKRELEEAKRQS